MATGARAFSRDTPVQTLTAIIEDEPRSLGDANPKTPIFLRWIVDHCLAKDPRQRYAATADLARDLRTLRDRLKETSTTSGTIERVHDRARRWPLVAAAISGAAAMFVLAATLLRPAPPSIPRFTPLASDSGYQGMPAWSPDGKTIAYVADVDGVRQVFTRSIASSLRAQITHAKFDCANPFWSADGGRIYYVSAAKEGLGIYSVSAAGGSPDLEQLNADGAVLSPDGRTLAFFRSDERDTNLQLWLSSPVGAEAKRYARTPFGELTFSDAFMRFTPDGSRLAVWARTWPMGPKTPSLWIVPIGPGIPYLVTGTPQDLSTNLPPRFDWSSDNRHIVAALERNGVQGLHLWLLDTVTGETTPLTSGAGAENTPAVSPDGGRIAYATQDTNFDLIEVPLDGSPARDLLATSRNELEPGWSPTGEEFAFVTNRTGRDEIWLRSRDGSWERPLVTSDSFSDHSTLSFRLPVFSPDGQKIAFERVSTNGATIWIATRAGGSPVQVTRGYAGKFLSTYSPTWSPDGEWIAFANADVGQWSLEKVRAGLATPPSILHVVTGDSHPQWSPDNRWIACSTAQGMSLVAPDGTSSKVLDEEAWIVYGWSKTGSTLYGVKQSDDLRELVLVSADVASGREQVLNQRLAPMPAVNTPIKGFSRISDRSFATSLVHVRSELWTIDNFKPQQSLSDRFWRWNWH
jgi:Tol biopolymer transport system component